MPKVSVIATVYNGESYFEEVVPGILDQTYEDFEWVIVDDGSTDGTGPLLKELAARDSRVRVFSPGRLGRARALNFAVEQARGEYIAQQDFDDVSYPDRLQLQVDFLDANPRVGVVGGYYVLIDDNRGERYIRMPPTDHDAIVKAMAKNIPFAHTVVTFRKEAWKQANGYPIMDDIEDLSLWISMGIRGWRFANIAEVIGEHRVHGSSFWHRSFKYHKRQQSLARVQWRAIKELDQPLWRGVYPLGRTVYPYMPTELKRLVRRLITQSRERDVPVKEDS